jgi:hypothetical protein
MKGTVFWRKDDSGTNYHLRFVISDPDAENKVMIVHMTTIYETGREDLSCVLVPGDHHCVKHRSYIRYDNPLVLDRVKILREKFNGTIQMVEDVTEEILLKIQEGARNNDALPEKFKPFIDYF